MANNTLPANLDRLFTLAEDMADGLHSLEGAVGVKQNTEAALRGDLKGARSAEADFQAARQAKTTATTAQTVADSNGKAWLGVARRTLVNSFGNAWSQAWADAGFPDNSTAVPDTIEKRQELLASLGNWLKTHPDHEVPAPNVQFTAARAGELFKALASARSGAKTAMTNTGSTKAIRDDTVEKLRRRMRGLIDELDLLLADDDPQWHQFGLNPPAATQRPDAPDQPILTPGAPGELHADWSDTRRAESYSVEIQVEGVDTDWRHAATVQDSDATLRDLPNGKKVKARIIARNEAGPSTPGPEAEGSVP